jgi:integrase
MSVEVTRKKDGSLRSKWWYGRFTVNGNETCVNLGIEIKGRVPESLKARGDDVFEHSRMKAQFKLESLIAEACNRKSAEQHLEKLYELKSGSALHQVPVTDICSHWCSLPVRRKRSALWEKNQCATLKDFCTFIQKEYPAAQNLSQITPKMAREWLAELERNRNAPATYNDKLHLLKGFFERSGHEVGILQNPFAGCSTKIKNTIHHQPFTQAELTAILEHSTGAVRSVFLVGMCTAMRQGDCCLLKWADVDLQAGFITVKTSKTGELAEIPLFPVLRTEIESQPRCGDYVFPEAAALYQKQNFGMPWRVKQVLKAAKIETDLVCKDRMQNATIKGFHSLRTTWITMALSAGVPMELVRRVTGHSTVEVVLKHYFRPKREEFRAALATAMPKMLTGGEEKESLDLPKAVLKLGKEAESLKPEEIVKKLKALAKKVARMTKAQKAAAALAA